MTENYSAIVAVEIQKYNKVKDVHTISSPGLQNQSGREPLPPVLVSAGRVKKNQEKRPAPKLQLKIAWWSSVVSNCILSHKSYRRTKKIEYQGVYEYFPIDTRPPQHQIKIFECL